jgi:hypothetical protein
MALEHCTSFLRYAEFMQSSESRVDHSLLRSSFVLKEVVRQICGSNKVTHEGLERKVHGLGALCIISGYNEFMQSWVQSPGWIIDSATRLVSL